MQTCGEETLATAAEPKAVAPWSVCLPWGGQLVQDEHGLHVKQGNPPADGVYDRIVVVDGCIVNALKSDAPTYVGSPCAPLPGGCGDSGGSGGGDGNLCNPSPMPGNLYKCDFTGRPLVQLSLVGGGGVSVIGNGTTENPYVISASGGGSGSGIYLRPGDDAIVVTGGGGRDDPYTITHKEGLQTTANGLVFDHYGHLIAQTDGSANAGVQGILPGDGIDVQSDPRSGIYTIGLTPALNNKAGTWLWGGYNVQLDNYNRIMDITQSINLGGEQTFTCGDKQVKVNALGSVTAIQPVSGGGGDNTAGGGGLVASVLWAGSSILESGSSLEADFVMPYDAPVAGFVLGPAMAAIMIDGVSMAADIRSFFSHPASLSAGTHHIRLNVLIAEENGYVHTPAMMLIFAAPNPVTVNTWE